MEMPLSSQALYLHLNMRADDDGFVGSPKKIARMIGAQDDDFKILLAKRFLLIFESGVCVVKHWKIHNYIQSDRYKPTNYTDEKSLMLVKDNGAYTECIQDGYSLDAQVRLGKARQGKARLVQESSELVANAPTPSETARDFFCPDTDHTEIISYLTSRGIPESVVKSELQKFLMYWTEPNKSGTKERWQMEKVFEVRRRLATWFGRIQSFNQNKETKGIII